MADNDKRGASLSAENTGRGEDMPELAGAVGKRHAFDSGCPQCGALLPAGRDKCLVCGAVRGARPYEGAFPVLARGNERPRPPEPDRDRIRAARSLPERWRRWVGGLSCAIVVLLAVLGGLGIYGEYFDYSSFLAGQAVVYQDSEGVLMLSHPGLEQPVAVGGALDTALDFSDGHVAESPNGRWIACSDGRGVLYRVDLSQGEATASLVTEDYGRGAVFSPNSEFLLYANQVGELYVSDLSESWRLDTSVVDILAVDERRVLYTRRGDGADRLDLYLSDLGYNGGERLVIDRDVTEVLDWTDRFEKLLYTTSDPRPDSPPATTLHRFELGDTGATTASLATDIGRVLDASAERGVVYCLVPSPQNWTYEQFVEDDLAAGDAVLREPDLADYPLVAEAVALYGDGGDFSDLADNEELVEQNNAYRALEQEWEEKQARDELRARLREVFSRVDEPVELGDLYVYRSSDSALPEEPGELTLLDTGVWNVEALTPANGQISAAGGYIAYEKIHTDTLRKLRMSDLWEDAATAMPDPVEYFLSTARRELLFARLGSLPARVYVRTDSRVFRQWRVSRSGEGIYFTAGPAAFDTPSDVLFYTVLTGAEPTDPAQVERDVSRMEGALQDGVLFWTGTGEDARLYFASNTTARSLGDVEVPYPPVNDGNTLLYIDRRSVARGPGDLNMLSGETGEQRLIAAAVDDYLYRSDMLMYLVREGRSGGDLYVWQDGNESLVARDVFPLSNQ